MDRLVNVERINSTAVLTIMNPPVNALSRSVADAMREVWAGMDAQRIVITGSDKMFVAGADIREIDRITKGEIPADLNYLNELLNMIEQSGRTVIMAMNGGALGIGLELAMAGHYRILKAGSSVGLPEVKLGLIPGAGATQRLPRLAGAATALRMILTGEPLTAAEALAAGIVDEVIDGDVVARGLAIETGSRTDQRRCAPFSGYDDFKPLAAPRQHSPLRAIEAVRAAVESASFEQGLAVERRLFEQALVDPQARAMVHLFFAERETSKVPGLGKDVVAAAITSVTEDGNEITIEASGSCHLRNVGPRVVEIRWTTSTSLSALAAALGYARKLGRIPIVFRADSGWLGSPTLTAEAGLRLVSEGEALRAGDIDVLMVRGFGYPEETGGPMHAYSTTPSQTSESAREPLK